MRSVNAAPEPAIVVAADMQLQDLIRFCTSANVYSPLTVDPTFSQGAFDVKLMTVQHLFLQTKRFLVLLAFVTRRILQHIYSLPPH